MSKNNVNFTNTRDLKIPEPPSPPLGRVIVVGTIGDCPNCASTTKRRPIIFGRKFCLNEDCVFHNIPI